MTNAVIHSDESAGEELELVVSMDGGLLRVSVADPGAGFAPPEPSLGDESGWGLFIVDRLSHRWGVERRGGTCVWFEIGMVVGAESDGAAATSTDGAEPDDAVEQHVRRRSAPRMRLRPQTTA